MLFLMGNVSQVGCPPPHSVMFRLTLLTVYNRTQDATSQFRESEEEAEPPQHLNLVDHFVSLLLAIFLEAGLMEVS
jgi:hypothetical protein